MNPVGAGPVRCYQNVRRHAATPTAPPCRASVDGQRASDATGVPSLSAAAEAAVGTLRAASDEKARGEASRHSGRRWRSALETRGCARFCGLVDVPGWSQWHQLHPSSSRPWIASLR